MPEIDPNFNILTGKPMGGSTLDPRTGLPTHNILTGKQFNANSPKLKFGSKTFAESNIHNSEYRMGYKEPISNFTKYDVPLGRNFDWEEIRYNNQSRGEQIAHGFGKAGITTLGAVAENTLGIIFGLGELASGGAYYDNVIGKGVDKMNEWARENMPNYYSRHYQDMSLLQRMGTTNFWADGVANGLGYSIGSIATIWGTGGLGAIGTGFKIAQAASKSRALYNTTKAITTGAKLGKQLKGGVNLSNRFRRGVQMTEAGLMMSLAEASVEARETQKQTYDNLIEEYLADPKNNAKNISEIPLDVLKAMEETSYSAGNAGFGLNLAVLTPTNLFMFGKMLSGFRAGSKVNKDLLWDATEKSVKSKLANRSVWRSALSRIKPAAQNSLVEATQEGSQFASNIYSSTYHTDKFHDGGGASRADAIVKALSDTFGTTDGREAMMIGAIVGGIMGGGQSIIGRQYANRVKNAQTAADLVNSGVFSTALANFKNDNASTSALQRMEAALKAGDIKAFKDEQFKLIQYQALHALKHGGFDVFMEKLNDSKNLSPEEFMKQFGYSATDESGNTISLEEQSGGRNQSEIVNSLRKKLNNFRETYDQVNEMFPLADKTQGLPRRLMKKEARAAEDAMYNKRVNLRDELVLTSSGIRDRNRRLEEIRKQMDKTVSSVLTTGPKININNLFSEEDVSIDPNKEATLEEQNDAILNKLRDVYKRLNKIDKRAAAEFAKQAQDYVNLTSENMMMLQRYDKLSSDSWYQNEFDKEVKRNQELQKQKVRNKQAEEALENANTVEEINDNFNREGVSPEIQTKADKKVKDLLGKEQKATKKYLKYTGSLEEHLEKLKEIDKTKLTPTEKAGLNNAIDILERRLDKENETGRKQETTVDNEEQTGKPLEEEKKLQDAFKPENLGGLESVSINGRSFQIAGVSYRNVNSNPLDAITYDKKGNVISIQLEDENGNRQSFWGPSGLILGLENGILASVQHTVDNKDNIDIDEANETAEVVKEEVDKEAGTKGKHGLKSSDQIRQEMYDLERGREELLESIDKIRSFHIQENNATKEDLKNIKEIKELSTKIRSVTSQISALKRILKVRGENTQTTSKEVLKAELAASKKIKEYEKKLIVAENSIEELETMVEGSLEAMRTFKEANDTDSWNQAAKENKIATQKLNDAKNAVKKLKRQINYQKNKLKNLENERQNRAAGIGAEAKQDPAKGAVQSVNEGQEPLDQKVPEEEGAPIEETEDELNNEELSTEKSAHNNKGLANQEKSSNNRGGFKVQSKEEFMRETGIDPDADFMGKLKKGIRERGHRQVAKLSESGMPDNYKTKMGAYKQSDLGGGQEGLGTEKNELVKESKTKEGKKYVKKQVDKLEKNSDGTITVYRVGSLNEGHTPVTVSRAVAETIAQERARQGLSSEIKEVKVKPEDISVVVPGIEGEVFIDVNKNNKSRLDENTNIIEEGLTLEALENRLASEKRDLENLENDIKSGKLNEKGFIAKEGRKQKNRNIKNLEKQIERKKKEAPVAPGKIRAGGEILAKVNFAKTIGFQGWEHVLQSLNKQLGKPKDENINEKRFETLTVEEIEDIASKDEEVQKSRALLRQAVSTPPEDSEELGVKAANDDNVIIVQEPNFKGEMTDKFIVPTDEEGKPIVSEPDTVNNETIPINKDLLLSPNIEGTEVEFEIIENDWFVANEKGSTNEWQSIPIYFKIGEEIVGKLEASDSQDRKGIVEKLQRGEKVTTAISKVMANNFNHSRVMGTEEKNFSNPEELFGKDEVLLAFTTVTDGVPQWTMSSVDDSKNVDGDISKIEGDLVSAEQGDTDYGQVAVVIRPKNNPQGIARIAIASTKFLSPTAQETVLKALEEKDYDTVKEIAATSTLPEYSEFNDSYLEIGGFENGDTYIVYKSPQEGQTIRIRPQSLTNALSGKAYSAEIVAPEGREGRKEKSWKKIKNVDTSKVDVKKDIKNLLELKKYNVSRDLGNTVGPYTSKVTNHTYTSYQEYLFSPKEFKQDNSIKGHNSILTTDLVKLGNRLFNNAQITFKKGNINGTTAQEVAQNTQHFKQTILDSSPEFLERMGLNMQNTSIALKKDELDQRCKT